MSIDLVDEITSDKLEIKNRKAQVHLDDSPTAAGYVRIVDADGHAIDTTENNYLRVSTSALVFYEQVDGSNVNTNLWNPSAISGMTITQASGFITLNGGSALTANAYAILQSNLNIPLYGTLPVLVEINAKVLNVPEANATVELGIGAAATNAAPTDGAFFRWSPTGGFYCVVNNGGTENTSGNISGVLFTDTNGDTITPPPSTNTIHLYTIEIVEDHVQFFIDDIQVADVQTPAGQAFPVNAGRQPILARVYNGGSTPSLAAQLFIGQVTVKQEDLYQNKTWAENLGSIGRGAFQSPVNAFGQTAQHANSAAPSSATLSNTAAGYTTLGGKYIFSVVSSAATDYALFAYQVPTGYQLVINDIAISSIVSTALGLTGTILEWAVGVNSSAVSLATADGSGTWGPRRIPLGVQGYGISTLATVQSSDIVRHFSAPLVVDSGRYLHIIVALPTSSSTGAIRGDVTISGYFQ